MRRSLLLFVLVGLITAMLLINQIVLSKHNLKQPVEIYQKPSIYQTTFSGFVLPDQSLANPGYISVSADNSLVSIVAILASLRQENEKVIAKVNLPNNQELLTLDFLVGLSEPTNGLRIYYQQTTAISPNSEEMVVKLIQPNEIIDTLTKYKGKIVRLKLSMPYSQSEIEAIQDENNQKRLLILNQYFKCNQILFESNSFDQVNSKSDCLPAAFEMNIYEPTN